MSVLIRGMEMPTSCGECKAFVCYRQWAGDSGDCFCGITKSDAKAGAQNADCPLVPVPKHGRLIDADAFAKDFEPNDADEDDIGKLVIGIFKLAIDDRPTIIPSDKDGAEC